MKGMIKFYNKDKGFGFVVGENGQDYYFDRTAFTGNEPTENAVVQFKVDIMSGRHPKHKLPPIMHLELLNEQARISIKKHGKNKAEQQDERPTCRKCDRKITPKLVTLRGRAEKSLCPFCGAIVETYMSPVRKVILRYIKLTHNRHCYFPY